MSGIAKKIGIFVIVSALAYGAWRGIKILVIKKQNGEGSGTLPGGAPPVVNKTPEEVCADAITAIGTVTINSLKDITNAETLYASLTPEQRAKIRDQHAILTSARQSFNVAKATATVDDQKALAKAISDSIGEITDPVVMDSEIQIINAEAMLQGSTAAVKAMIANQGNLQAARANFNALKACITAINAIGTVDVNSGALLDNASGLYKALSDKVKANVTNYSVLEKATNDYAPIAQLNTVALSVKQNNKFPVTDKTKQQNAQYLFDNFSNVIEGNKPSASDIKNALLDAGLAFYNGKAETRMTSADVYSIMRLHQPKTYNGNPIPSVPLDLKPPYDDSVLTRMRGHGWWIGLVAVSGGGSNPDGSSTGRYNGHQTVGNNTSFEYVAKPFDLFKSSTDQVDPNNNNSKITLQNLGGDAKYKNVYDIAAEGKHNTQRGNGLY